MDPTVVGKPESDPLVGKQLGGCRIEGCLGRGGMGTVYRAHHLRLDKTVAVKVLSATLSSVPELVERFTREARSAARLEHPNIVQVHDVGKEKTYNYIIMQFVQGETLQKIVRKKGPYPLAEAVRIVRDIAAGLGAAHQRGVIHRDIKSSNILVTPDGAIRIADFGLARQMEQTEGLTIEGTFMGTPEYVSPEQAEGRAVDPRSDLYSLGIVFFELLSGKVPFRGDTPMQTAMKQISEPPPPLQGVDPAAVAVVRKLLAKDPAQRYKDADELTQDLARLVAPRPQGPAKPAAPLLPPLTATAPKPPVNPALPRLPPPSTLQRPPTTRRSTLIVPPQRVSRNVGYWALILGAACLAVALGGLSSTAFEGREAVGFIEGLALPFQPDTPGFVLRIVGALMMALLVVAGFVVNQSEYQKSSIGGLAGVAAAAGVALLFAGALFLPAWGAGEERAVSAAESVGRALLERVSLVTLAAGLAVPSFFGLGMNRPRREIKGLCALGLALASASIFAYARGSAAGHAASQEAAGAGVGLACLPVGVVSLGLALAVLLRDPSSEMRIVGFVLCVVALAGFYGSGALWFAAEGAEVMTLLTAPLEDLRSRFVVSGGPAVAGLVCLSWSAFALYRRPAW